MSFASLSSNYRVGTKTYRSPWSTVIGPERDGETLLIQTFVPPAVFVFVIVQPMDEMGVVVQSIGSRLRFVVVLAVIARGRLLFGSLPDDAKLVVGVLDNFL
jgi:hypothetical protein